MPIQPTPGLPSAPPGGVSARSVLIGLGCVVLSCWADLYSNMIQKSSYLGGTLMSVAVIFIFLMVVLFFNGLLRLLSPRLALRQPELAVVFIMTLVATGLSSFGWAQMFYPYLTSFRYYASPTNHWARTLHPELAKSLIPILPTEQNLAIQQLYEGLRPGQAIPWRDWAAPLAWWGSFFLALFYVLFSIAVVLRKQWVERERLVFPLLQAPLEIIQAEDGRGFNRFLRNPLVWAGMALPIFFDAWASLHYFFPVFSPVRYSTSIENIFGFHTIGFDLNWAMMGFTYLISLDVAFSLWIFSWAKSFFTQASSYLGWSIGAPDPYSATPALMSFCIGAIVVMALLSLWTARQHLLQVCRKAFTRAPDVDDSAECLPYRAAVIGGLLCLAYMWLWLCLAGMQWWLPPLVIGLALTIFLAVTRAAVEGGVPTATVSWIPQTAIPRLLGLSAISSQSLVAIGLCFTWIADVRVIVLPFFAHAVRLADSVRMKRRSLSWITLGAALAAMIAATLVLFQMCYTHGGINLNQWFFQQGGCNRSAIFAHQFITEKMSGQPATSLARWTATAAGAGAFAFLSFMRYRFIWWPLHPIGLPLLVPSWTTIAIIWAAKALIIKYGGAALFRRLKPLFLGLILGKFTSAGIWFILDMAFGVFNHVLYNR